MLNITMKEKQRGRRKAKKRKEKEKKKEGKEGRHLCVLSGEFWFL